MSTLATIFSPPRQLVALTTFSDLVEEARERVEARRGRCWPAQTTTNPCATVAPAPWLTPMQWVYLGVRGSKAADRNSSLCAWEPNTRIALNVANRLARQALPMVWDYAEANPFSGSGATSMARRNR